MIEVRGITKYYGTFKALDDVSFDVAKGEVLGFLGPNGAGKSTTMKVLTTYISASQGTARVAGFDVHAQPHEVRRRIGYLPETPPLYGDMIVEDYLAFAGRARGLNGPTLKQRLDVVVAETGLARKLKSRVSELSKGFKQRTGIAQALIHDPEVLILDEPTSGLDPMQIIEIRNLIDRLRKDKCIIFSTHILQEATAVASRLVIVNGGRKVADGTVDDLARQASDNQKVRVLARGGDGLQDALRTVAGVLSVDRHNPPQGYTRLELVTSGGALGARAVCEKVFELCRSRGIALAELAPQGMTLEDIFLQMLRGKPTTPVADAQQLPDDPDATAAATRVVGKPTEAENYSAMPAASETAWDVIDAGAITEKARSMGAKTETDLPALPDAPDPFATAAASGGMSAADIAAAKRAMEKKDDTPKTGGGA
ncbi:MAG: ATP-binding cassette domain-containing protein [Planctomycetes bacterium]|nr:ATP-binding cassette domain-containing protein [Planctomycetota bacterium]